MKKFDTLYKWVLKNLGKREFNFKQVEESDFTEYLKNYPRTYETNSFMGWIDYYDFFNFKDGDSHWDYHIARRYVDYGANEYYLPIIEKEWH